MGFPLTPGLIGDDCVCCGRIPRNRRGSRSHQPFLHPAKLNSITQSTPDGTGPAVNNSSLENIQDLQAYTVTIVFPGSITAPGTYTGSTLTFSDPSAPASETGFSSISL